VGQVSLGSAETATQTFSFGRNFRLNTAADFRRVFKQAKRSKDRYFTVLWQTNRGSTARIGFAVAKKSIPLAVGRNRIRRLARESFRHERATLGSVDIVVLAQPAAGKVSKASLTRSLEHHWEKIKNS
jgi:ribonuclease P protein component